MATLSAFAPKQYQLSSKESLASFKQWQRSLLFALKMQPDFKPYIAPNAKWNKWTAASPYYGLTDDPDPESKNHQTKEQKAATLDIMLGYIANLAPLIAPDSIIKYSTCLNDVWQTIRHHYHIETSGAHLPQALSHIQLDPGEQPNDLYERLVTLVEDNLAKANSDIKHLGETVQTGEDITPMVRNMTTWIWLHKLHPDLVDIVCDRYATELTGTDIASIKTTISKALPTLMQQVNNQEINTVRRSNPQQDRGRSTQRRYFNPPRVPRGSSFNKRQPNNPRRFSAQQSQPNRLCPLCKEAKRPDTRHYLTQCRYLPESEKAFFGRIRHVFLEATDEEQQYEDEEVFNEGTYYDQEEYTTQDQSGSSRRAVALRRTVHTSDSSPQLYQADPIYDKVMAIIRSASTSDVPISHVARCDARKSAILPVQYKNETVNVIIDSGAELNLMKYSTARRLNMKLVPASIIILQADGVTPLEIAGEVHTQFHRDNLVFHFDAIIVYDLQEEILVGMPFVEDNMMTNVWHKKLIIFKDGSTYRYDTKPTIVNRLIIATPRILRVAQKETIWPNNDVTLPCPPELLNQKEIAIEPRWDYPQPEPWLPVPIITHTTNGEITVPNKATFPFNFQRHSHVAQAVALIDPAALATFDPPQTYCSQAQVAEPDPITKITINPDSPMTPAVRQAFLKLHMKHRNVFAPHQHLYNDAMGKFRGIVHMGPTPPPQRKGRVPQYARDKLSELQLMCDKLEQDGVLAKPEDVNVSIEYLSPSFLVKKQSGGYRMVTAFGEIGKHCLPQPALMPSVDSTLRLIAQWTHIITTDLSAAFFQIPLAHSSYKFCGIATPFRGVRCYTRCAMGQPGSEASLEELLSRMFGDLLQQGKVARLADDMYLGGETLQEILDTWTIVLQRLDTCNMGLSPSKTMIDPTKTTVLGWLWCQGTLQATPHRISTLSTCSKPTTATGMRSYVGSYKILARVIPHTAQILDPLEVSYKQLDGKQPILWTEELTTAFNKAQAHLKNNQIIALPTPDHQIWIVTDGATSTFGLGATFYITKDSTNPVLAGFFSAKLRQNQALWLPCEVEALAIATAVKYFAPFLVQSKHRATVYTDSKPCVQAFTKIQRGEFSSSPRVLTFISTICRYGVDVKHLKGKLNGISDHSSRNPPECNEPRCQVCIYTNQAATAAVYRVPAHDIISGSARVPYTNPTTWLAIQAECQDITKVVFHLTQATRPKAKDTNIKDVKRYLNTCTLSKSNNKLLVHTTHSPFLPDVECTVVPRSVIHGLLTALHLRLEHPAKQQLLKVTTRHFYALDLDQAVSSITEYCHQCATIRPLPQLAKEQTSTTIPQYIGTHFAADVFIRNTQRILVVREVVSAYTLARLIPSEKTEDVREGLISIMSHFRGPDSPCAVIRTDNAASFSAIYRTDGLKCLATKLELGHVKNPNKNPIGERGIQELESEIKTYHSHQQHLSQSQLDMVTAHLNARLRNHNLSATEIWLKRNQYTGQPLPLNEEDVIHQNMDRKNHNHPQSTKAKGGKPVLQSTFSVGDIVYLRSEGSKHTPRPRYYISDITQSHIEVRKFTDNLISKESKAVKPHDIYAVPAYTGKPHQSQPEHGTEQLRAILHSMTSDQRDQLFAIPTPTDPPRVEITQEQHQHHLPTPNTEPPQNPPDPDEPANHPLDEPTNLEIAHPDEIEPIMVQDPAIIAQGPPQVVEIPPVPELAGSPPHKDENPPNKKKTQNKATKKPPAIATRKQPPRNAPPPPRYQ